MFKKIATIIFLLLFISMFQNCSDYSNNELEMLVEEDEQTFNESNFSGKTKKNSAFSTRGLKFSTPRNYLKTTSGKTSITRSKLFLTTKSGSMRAIDNKSDGDVGHLRFRYRGKSDKVSKLASGKVRTQFGLKLKSPNTCNVLYVMWRVYPTEKISIALKENKGKKRHAQCGANGYRNIASLSVPKSLTARTKKTRYLSAEIVSEKYLNIFLNRKLIDSIKLDTRTRKYLRRHRRTGRTGIRSDNASLIFKFMVER